jgi:antitoxin component YwqK of YwqJK toxin-antitoxin module
MSETSYNYSGVYRTYYDLEKTQLKSEVFIHNGKRNGVYKRYRRNGQLISEVFIHNGKRNGILKLNMI